MESYCQKDGIKQHYRNDSRGPGYWNDKLTVFETSNNFFVVKNIYCPVMLYYFNWHH